MLRRLAPALLSLVGLVFAVVGGVSLISLTWAKAAGTVQSCEAATRQDASGKSRRIEYECQVRWQADGASHTTTINSGSNPYGQGAAVDLRVSGNNAVLDTPAWVGVISLTGGLVLVGVGAVLFLRARRPA